MIKYSSAFVVNEVLSKQEKHWENTFTNRKNMFGETPSNAAQKAVELFKKEGKTKIVELGGGQGRDTLFFARQGFHVVVLDYSQIGIDAITQRALEAGLSHMVRAICHDVRKPFPFKDESFDGCYSHMLYCMALETSELESISHEIERILKPGGLNIYTVRNTNDADYGKGIHRGEDLYEVSGFIVHFFSMAKVEQLANGFQIVGVDEFEEGPLPRKLFRVTLRKRVN